MVRPAAWDATRVRPAPKSRLRPGFLSSLAVSFALCFGLVWLFVACAPMAFLSRDYPLLIAKRTLIDACRPGVVAFFGDSRAVAGIVPASMDLPVVNDALSGISPIETYQEVTRVLACPTPPRLVVIAHSPLKYASDGEFWTFGAKMGFFSLRELLGILATAARLGESGVFSGPERMPASVGARLFAWRFPGFYVDSLIHGGIAARWLHNRRSESEAIASSGYLLFGRANGSAGLATEAGVASFAASPTVDHYLDLTLEALARRGVPVVLMTMPVNRATFQSSTAAMRGQFDAYRRRKAQQFAGVTVLGPPLPCWPDTAFGDAWHFNAAGSAAFSKALTSSLRAVLAGAPAPFPDRCG